MKKLIVITMAILMIVSCVSTTASAIPVNINTWNNSGWEGLNVNTTISEGKTVLAKTYTKPMLATWDAVYKANPTNYENIAFNRVFDEAYNISEMKYLSLELYATDKRIFDKVFIIELTSAGAKDANENNIRSALTKYTTSIGEDWYKIEIPIVDISRTENGSLNKENCNYMRMYYDDNTEFEVGEGFTFGIRKISFAAEKAYQRGLDELLDIDVFKAISGLDSNPTLCVGETVYSRTYTKPLHASWVTEGFSMPSNCERIVFNNSFESAVDISQMRYFTLEVYTTDRGVFEHRFIVELTSSGMADSQENNLAKPLDEYVSDIGNNWYRIEIPIADIKTQVKGGLNKENCNYMRMYYDDGSGTPFNHDGNFVFGVRGMGFSMQKTSEIRSHYIKGVSIRCEDPSGIRFMANFDRSDTRLTNPGANNANFGVILISEKKFAKNPNMSFDEMVDAGIKVAASNFVTTDEGFYGVYAVLTGIEESHFKDNVVAVPYIDDDFAGEAVIANIYGVAKLVAADTQAEQKHRDFCNQQIIAKVETTA